MQIKYLQKNQIMLSKPLKAVFISYEKNIAFIDFDKKNIYLNSQYFNYSKTTSKYLNLFFKAYRIALTVKELKQCDSQATLFFNNRQFNIILLNDTNISVLIDNNF